MLEGTGCNVSTVLVSDEFAPVARRAWIWTVVRGVAAIAFGILALVWPMNTAVAVAILVGIFAVVDGVIDLVEAIRFRGSVSTGSRVLLGVVSLVFGLLVLFWPRTSLGVLAVLFGLWWIIIGALQIIANLQIRHQSGRSWIWGVVAGAVAVIFGIVVLIWPKAGIVTLIWIVGLWAIIFGVALLLLGFYLHRVSKSIVPSSGR